MKLGAPRGINTNFIQSCVEQKWHSAHFSNSGVKWLDRGAVLILFHGLYLRTFAPNYLTLPSPNTVFSTWSFVLGISTINKMSFPSSHLFKRCPSFKTQTKAILISFSWILQSEIMYPFSEHPQCLLGLFWVWFWDYQLQKCIIICIFTKIRRSSGNFLTVFTSLLCHS